MTSRVVSNGAPLSSQSFHVEVNDLPMGLCSSR